MTYKHFSPLTDPRINWARVDHDALRMLDEARSLADIPFRVTSTFREGPQHLAHGETPCTAFDLGYKDHQFTRDWVKSYREAFPTTFSKGNGRRTYNAMKEKYFGINLNPKTGQVFILPDAIRIILACMRAGFPRIGIQLGPGNEHVHVDCSPIQLKITGKVVFVE